MRIDDSEVELAGDQEDCGPDGGQSSEATSSALGRLEQTIDGFEEAVCLAGPCPSDDAFHVATNQRSNLLHRFDLGTHDAVAPVAKLLTHDVDLPALER